MSTVFEGMYESSNSDGKYLYSGTDQSIYSIDSQGNGNLVTASEDASLIIAYQDGSISPQTIGAETATS